jgi:hypothetical protein
LASLTGLFAAAFDSADITWGAPERMNSSFQSVKVDELTLRLHVSEATVGLCFVFYEWEAVAAELGWKMLPSYKDLTDAFILKSDI